MCNITVIDPLSCKAKFLNLVKALEEGSLGTPVGTTGSLDLYRIWIGETDASPVLIAISKVKSNEVSDSKNFEGLHKLLGRASRAFILNSNWYPTTISGMYVITDIILSGTEVSILQSCDMCDGIKIIDFRSSEYRNAADSGELAYYRVSRPLAELMYSAGLLPISDSDTALGCVVHNINDVYKDSVTEYRLVGSVPRGSLNILLYVDSFMRFIIVDPNAELFPARCGAGDPCSVEQGLINYVGVGITAIEHTEGTEDSGSSRPCTFVQVSLPSSDVIRVSGSCLADSKIAEILPGDSHYLEQGEASSLDIMFNKKVPLSLPGVQFSDYVDYISIRELQLMRDLKYDSYLTIRNGIVLPEFLVNLKRLPYLVKHSNLLTVKNVNKVASFLEFGMFMDVDEVYKYVYDAVSEALLSSYPPNGFPLKDPSPDKTFIRRVLQKIKHNISIGMGSQPSPDLGSYRSLVLKTAKLAHIAGSDYEAPGKDLILYGKSGPKADWRQSCLNSRMSLYGVNFPGLSPEAAEVLTVNRLWHSEGAEVEYRGQLNTPQICTVVELPVAQGLKQVQDRSFIFRISASVLSEVDMYKALAKISDKYPGMLTLQQEAGLNFFPIRFEQPCHDPASVSDSGVIPGAKLYEVPMRGPGSEADNPLAGILRSKKPGVIVKLMRFIREQPVPFSLMDYVLHEALSDPVQLTALIISRLFWLEDYPIRVYEYRDSWNPKAGIPESGSKSDTDPELRKVKIHRSDHNTCSFVKCDTA